MTSVSLSLSPKRRPADAAQFLTARFLSRYASRHGFQPAYRLGFKALRRPAAFSAWLAELEAFRTRLGLDEAGLDHYVAEPLRPFMRAGLNFDRRLQISRSHHVAVGAVMTTGVLQNIWAGRPTRLGLVEGRRNSTFALWLSCAEYVREGGLEIMISRETADRSAAVPLPPVPLARATFSLCETVDTGYERALLIGGLQGCPQPLGKGAIVEATRDLRGMRPKTAVALAAQAFARFGHCRSILAVSDNAHIINLRGVKKREQKAASYDAFWLERGGAPRGFLGFELPMDQDDERAARKAIFNGVASAFSSAE